MVPSLIADRLVEEEHVASPADDELIVEAERHVEEAAAIGTDAAVLCPVCGEHLSLADAAEHEHLRIGSPA
jgi:hypothetical protein